MPSEHNQPLPSPAGLPSWPRFSVAHDQQSCTVSGWHLTPVRARVAGFLAGWSTLGLLVFIGWYYWGWTNIPDWLRIGINTVAAKLGFSYFAIEKRRWVYIGLWLCCWLAWRLWEWLFYLIYATALWRRTTITFTTAYLTLRPSGRQYDRKAKIAFSSKPHPKLLRLQAKAQRRGSSKLNLLYQEIRVLIMEYGQTAVQAAHFRWPEDAERFAAVCHFAMEYAFKKPDETKPTAAAADTELENEDDV